MNLLVSGWVTLRTSDCIGALMFVFYLPIPILHILDSFMAFTLVYCNEVHTFLITLCLLFLSLLSSLFGFVSLLSSLISIYGELELQVSFLSELEDESSLFPIGRTSPYIASVSRVHITIG